MLEKLLNFIFPITCLECGKISNSSICMDCLKLIEYGEIIKCENREINYLISLFKYEKIRSKILRFKFYNSPYMYNYFADLILNNDKIVSLIKKFDIIIPIPMYKKKMQERGYNQTELIANKIGKELNIKVRTNILVKTKNTKTQSLLKYKDRINNLKDSFEVRNVKSLENKNVLLIDDIYTTGSTIIECCRSLKRNVILKGISVLVVAK